MAASNSTIHSEKFAVVTFGSIVTAIDIRESWPYLMKHIKTSSTILIIGGCHGEPNGLLGEANDSLDDIKLQVSLSHTKSNIY